MTLRIFEFVFSVLGDTKYGLRGLRRHRGLTLTAVLTLALAVGFTTSVFTVFNSVVLRPWPVAEPDRVVRLLASEKGEVRTSGFSFDAFQHFQSNAVSFSELIATRQLDLIIGDGGSGESRGLLVTPGFFRALGVKMRLGRHFDETDDGEAVAVLSHRLWQSRMAGDPGIVGGQVRLNGVPFYVVGVTAPEFTGTRADGEDFWIPKEAEKRLFPPVYWENWTIAGRLSEGVNSRQAETEIELLNRQFRAEHQLRPTNIAAVGTSLLSSPEGRAEMLPVFALMSAGVLLVLLLASANVGNLMLARSAMRQREIAARLALGASRLRLLRQLMTESMVLAVAGGSLGFLLAAWLPRTIMSLYTSENVDWIKPDLRVLLFTLLAAGSACLVFGLAPALQATRISLADAVKEQYSRLLGRQSLRSCLIGAQVVISVVLLVCASLLVRSVQTVSSRDAGFRQDGVRWAEITLPGSDYDEIRALDFVERLRDEAAQSGFWSSVAITSRVPLGPGLHGLGIDTGQGPDGLKMAFAEEVSPEYFPLLDLPILMGRGFERADRYANVVVINETMARRLGSGPSLIGSTIGSGRASYEIIGIVKDAHTVDLYRVEPTLYQLYATAVGKPRVFRPKPTLLLRSDQGSRGDSMLRSMVTRLEPRASVRVQSLADNVEDQLKPARAGAALAAFLGLVALVLAAVGLVGVFGFSVRRQSREIATRMALGARPAQVVAKVLLSSSRPAAIGLGIGLVAALAVSRLLEAHLYGVSSMDPLTYLLVGSLVALCGLAASIWPACLIVRVDPAIALRSE
jgi:predicted permease